MSWWKKRLGIRSVKESGPEKFRGCYVLGYLDPEDKRYIIAQDIPGESVPVGTRCKIDSQELLEHLLLIYETSLEEIETLLNDNQKVTLAFEILCPLDGEEVLYADLKSVFWGSVEDFRGLEEKHNRSYPQNFRYWQHEGF